tara:strand:- start:85 stop:393 length:309 start_codon:yes stop_codon:yes gene_type:complete
MYKKITYMFLIVSLITSCGNTLDSVKRGLTGEKQKSTDEFFIKKKDPLILPPDYENLPTPGERSAAGEEIYNFEKTLGTSIEETSQTAGTVEESILKKIKSK